MALQGADQVPDPRHIVGFAPRLDPLCGASAVQVGTANYLNPMAALEVAEGVAEYARRHGFPRVSELIGALDFG